MRVLVSPLSSHPLPGDTSIASLHPGQGTGSSHPILRAPAASAQTPISSVPAWYPVSRCHGATWHVLTAPSRGTAAHALPMACRRPHSSSGCPPSPSPCLSPRSRRGVPVPGVLGPGPAVSGARSRYPTNAQPCHPRKGRGWPNHSGRKQGTLNPDLAFGVTRLGLILFNCVTLDKSGNLFGLRCPQL